MALQGTVNFYENLRVDVLFSWQFLHGCDQEQVQQVLFKVIWMLQLVVLYRLKLKNGAPTFDLLPTVAVLTVHAEVLSLLFLALYALSSHARYVRIRFTLTVEPVLYARFKLLPKLLPSAWLLAILLVAAVRDSLQDEVRCAGTLCVLPGN